MSGTAQIYADAQLTPTKQEIALEHGAIQELIGSARLLDPAGEVGIEFLFGNDEFGRLRQLPVTYRSAEVGDRATLTTLEHSELGTRWVSVALGDSVAVTAIIRAIVTAGEGAAYSAGEPAFDLQGSGGDEGSGDSQVQEAQIAEFSTQRAQGTVTIDGAVRGYILRMSNLPHAPRSAGGPTGTDYSTSRLNLVATPRHGECREPLVLAELVLTE
ncbi:CG0192 family protein [Corynebacterium tapiri]|uniref:Maltokinase N-terminal cap domain-containing protein n=1 Tax=Corynebacterium tapiri TaxID=1448266 RepID=A0A5C4U296_9CORY|nr:hypothetical protein [Corynebacterium tapiri]TNL94843.1 hypothetical protein FHE74_10075 [Corynebacterium tapiri]